MKTRTLLAMALGLGIAFLGLDCAPVDPAASGSGATGEPTARAPSPEVSIAVPGPRQTSTGTTTPPADALKTRIDAAIEQIRRRELRTDNGFWTVFHGILGLGPSVELVNPLTGQHVKALEYICSGGKVPGLHFIPTPSGLDVETGPGSFVKQGHQDQFVAEMVEWGVSPERKFLVDGKEHPFSEFLRYSQAHASVKTPDPQELEWALVVIGTQFGTDCRWTNSAGEELRFEDLVRAELDKDMDKSACGGTHLLFGLTWAYHLHLRHGGQATGIWKEVADRIALYVQRARAQQNADGSFSTAYFRERAEERQGDLRIGTTGHILEWLALALSDDDLKQPWVQSAASALAMMFLENQSKGIDGGSMYHAVHGLILYSSRVYGKEQLGESAPHDLPLLPAKKG